MQCGVENMRMASVVVKMWLNAVTVEETTQQLMAGVQSGSMHGDSTSESRAESNIQAEAVKIYSSERREEGINQSKPEISTGSGQAQTTTQEYQWTDQC